MKLWLLRHGQAEAQITSDAARRLTEHGRREALHSAQALLQCTALTIVSSPFIRARQTAELVRETLGIRAEVEIVPWLTPDIPVQEAMSRLASRSEGELLLVSHQPLIGDLAGLLEHGHRQQALPMATASLAAFSGELPLAGGMQLDSVQHPVV